MQALVAAHPVAAPAAFVALYALIVAFSIPEAALATVTAGLLFGPWVGGGLAVLGATLGAVLLFLVARTALAGFMARRAQALLGRIRPGLERDGFSYLLALRLLPIVPFWLVNLGAALCGMRLFPVCRGDPDRHHSGHPGVRLDRRRGRQRAGGGRPTRPVADLLARDPRPAGRAGGPVAGAGGLAAPSPADARRPVTPCPPAVVPDRTAAPVRAAVRPARRPPAARPDEARVRPRRGRRRRRRAVGRGRGRPARPQGGADRARGDGRGLPEHRLRALQGAARRGACGRGSARRGPFRHHPARPRHRLGGAARACAGCDRRDRPGRFRRPLPRPGRRGDRRHRPLPRSRHPGGRRATDHRATNRDRRRLPSRGAAGPRPRGRAVPDQRDAVRPPRAARASADPGRRADRAGNGRRARRPRLPGHAGGGGADRRQGRPRAGGGAARRARRAGRDAPRRGRGGRGRTGPGPGAGRRAADRRQPSAGRHRPPPGPRRAGAGSRRGARLRRRHRHRPRSAQPDQPARVRGRRHRRSRGHRPARLHPCRQPSCRHRDPPRGVPPAGAGLRHGAAAGDLHQPGARPGRADGSRSPGRRAPRAGAALAAGGDRPRPDRPRPGRAGEAGGGARTCAGRRHPRPARRRDDRHLDPGDRPADPAVGAGRHDRALPDPRGSGGAGRRQLLPRPALRASHTPDCVAGWRDCPEAKEGQGALPPGPPPRAEPLEPIRRFRVGGGGAAGAGRRRRAGRARSACPPAPGAAPARRATPPHTEPPEGSRGLVPWQGARGAAPPWPFLALRSAMCAILPRCRSCH